MKTTRFLTRSALSAAVSVVLLYLCGVIPSGRLAVLCVCSLGTVFVTMSCGTRWALGTYAVTAVLGLLLCPVKSVSIAYAAFSGWYPVAKLPLERLKRPAVRRGAKLLCFNAAFLPAFFLFRSAFFPAVSPVIFVPAAEAAFLVYDYALKQLILFYIRKIARRLN